MERTKPKIMEKKKKEREKNYQKQIKIESNKTKNKFFVVFVKNVIKLNIN